MATLVHMKQINYKIFKSSSIAEHRYCRRRAWVVNWHGLNVRHMAHAVNGRIQRKGLPNLDSKVRKLIISKIWVEWMLIRLHIECRLNVTFLWEMKLKNEFLKVRQGYWFRRTTTNKKYWILLIYWFSGMHEQIINWFLLIHRARVG